MDESRKEPSPLSSNRFFCVGFGGSRAMFHNLLPISQEGGRNRTISREWAK